MVRTTSSHYYRVPRDHTGNMAIISTPRCQRQNEALIPDWYFHRLSPRRNYRRPPSLRLSSTTFCAKAASSATPILFQTHAAFFSLPYCVSIDFDSMPLDKHIPGLSAVNLRIHGVLLPLPRFHWGHLVAAAIITL